MFSEIDRQEFENTEMTKTLFADMEVNFKVRSAIKWSYSTFEPAQEYFHFRVRVPVASDNFMNHLEFKHKCLDILFNLYGDDTIPGVGGFNFKNDTLHFVSEKLGQELLHHLPLDEAEIQMSNGAGNYSSTVTVVVQ